MTTTGILLPARPIQRPAHDIHVHKCTFPQVLNGSHTVHFCGERAHGGLVLCHRCELIEKNDARRVDLRPVERETHLKANIAQFHSVRARYAYDSKF